MLLKKMCWYWWSRKLSRYANIEWHISYKFVFCENESSTSCSDIRWYNNFERGGRFNICVCGDLKYMIES
jgi:hypothetical protein